MELNQKTEARRYKAARKKARAIRGFYINLAAYCVVIPALAVLNYIYTPDVKWFFLTMACWGTGLFFHWMDAFGRGPFFGPAWEARKIQEWMAKDPGLDANTRKIMELHQDAALDQVQKQIRSIRGFYMHILFYALANAIVPASIYFDLADKSEFWSFNVFWTPIVWGLGLLLHAGFVYGHTLFGPGWESRKIREFMEKEND